MYKKHIIYSIVDRQLVYTFAKKIIIFVFVLSLIFISISCLSSTSSMDIDSELENKYLTCVGTVEDSYKLLNNGYINLEDSPINEMSDQLLSDLGISRDDVEQYAQEYEDYQNYLASSGMASMIKNIAMSSTEVTTTETTVIEKPEGLLGNIGDDINPTEIIFKKGSISEAYIYDVDYGEQIFNSIMYSSLDFADEIVDLFMSDDGIGTSLASQIYRPNEYNILISYSIDSGGDTFIPVSDDTLLGATLSSIKTSSRSYGTTKVSIFITPESKVTTARLPTKEYKIIFVSRESAATTP